MVLIEEIIALQRHDLPTQKQQKLEKQAYKGPIGGQGHSSKVTSKGKEEQKGITIKEPALQSKQTVASQDVLQSKRDRKMKVGESGEAPLATWARTKSARGSEIFPVSTAPITDEKLVIHKHLLYRTMVPFNKDASLLSNSSAMLLNSPLYNMKLACSFVPVFDWQFVMKTGMVNSLNKLIDLNLKVNIIIVCFSEA